jgi:hypothetical protein
VIIFKLHLKKNIPGWRRDEDSPSLSCCNGLDGNPLCISAREKVWPETCLKIYIFCTEN